MAHLHKSRKTQHLILHLLLTFFSTEVVGAQRLYSSRNLTEIYYVDGDVKLSDGDFYGAATFVATGKIEVAGSDGSLNAYCDNDLLFFSNKEHSESDKRCTEAVIDLPGSNNFKFSTIQPNATVYGFKLPYVLCTGKLIK